MIPNKKRKEYINSLYSKKEQIQIKEYIETTRRSTQNHITDFLLLDEKLRILKKHFKLTEKEFNEIIDKYRVPSKAEESILKILNSK